MVSINEEHLYSILDEYEENWAFEPLDGDGVDKLVKYIKNRLNLINGNITRKEFDNLEKNIK